VSGKWKNEGKQNGILFYGENYKTLLKDISKA
jgi:hypothetical protein